MQPRAVEEKILENHIGNRANNPNTVAGAIDDAVLYEEVVDVAAGDGVVAGKELAADDVDVATGLIYPAAEVDAIPAASNFDPIDVHLLGKFEHNSVVRRVLYCNITYVHITAVAEDNCVWSAHFLFAAWIEDLIAVDDTGPDNVYVVDIDAKNERAMPLAESCLRSIGRWGKVLGVVQIGSTY